MKSGSSLVFGVWGNNQIRVESPSVLKQHRREVTQTLIAALIKEHREPRCYHRNKAWGTETNKNQNTKLQKWESWLE